MITGFFKKNPNGNDYFDYSGIVYPEGNVNGVDNILFNHSDIISILYKGMITEEETIYKEKLKSFISSITQPENSFSTSKTPVQNHSMLETSNENNSGIQVLDINNIDLTPAPSSVEASSIVENSSNQEQEQKDKKPNYVFGPDGTIISM